MTRKRNFLTAAVALFLMEPAQVLPAFAASAPKPVAKVQVNPLESYISMKSFVTGKDPSGNAFKKDIAYYFKTTMKTSAGRSKAAKYKTEKLPNYEKLKKLKKADIIDFVAFSIGDPGDKIMALRLAYGVKEGTFSFQSDTQKMLMRLMIVNRAGDIWFKRPGTGGPESAIARELRDAFGLDIFIASKY